MTGAVEFVATVSAEGTVTSVRVLRVPASNLGFEDATRRAVLNWRFEPARFGERPVEGAYAGAVRFQLQPKEEDAIAAVVRQAFEIWVRTSSMEETVPGPRVKVGGEKVTQTSVLERRLIQGFASVRERADTLHVDAIQFEGEDEAWATTTLRLHNPTENRQSFRTLLIRKDGHWYSVFSETNSPFEALVGTATTPSGDSALYDADPIPLVVPPDPPYPRKAKEQRIGGDVILQVAVELDGSTTVLRVVKSLRYCNAIALENARKWRWKPAVKNGAPVRALGIITVSFEIYGKGNH